MTKAISYTHPLDPLSAEEVEACSRACASYAAAADLDNLRFNLISLKVRFPIITRFQLASYSTDCSCSLG